MNKNSLANKTIEMIKEKGKIEERKLRAETLYEEVKKKLENGEFTAEKSKLTGVYIITVELEKEQKYEKKVERMLNEMFKKDGFVSAAYNHTKTILTAKEWVRLFNWLKKVPKKKEVWVKIFAQTYFFVTFLQSLYKFLDIKFEK